MARRYRIATQDGFLEGDFPTKKAARKALAAEVREAARDCRRSKGACSIVGTTQSGSVQIRIGGRQGYHLWQRYVINEDRR